MAALHLDHVNIRTARLADCIDFYGRGLGLRMAPPPMAQDMSRGAYGCDETGRAIVHLVATDAVVEGGPPPVRGAAQRGMIDHFAIHCSDADSHAARLAAAGLSFDRSDVPQIGLHLIFVRDPNGVLIELNFPLEA